MNGEKAKNIQFLKILKFSDDGWGIAHYDNPNGNSYTVEVPFTMPGDSVNALLLKRRGGVYNSLLEEVVEPSPERIAPKCVHFAHCGGCRWQHVPYEKQLALKHDFVKKAFEDFGLSINPLIACHPPWNYRNKMEFSFSSNLAGKKYLGLILQGSRGCVFNLHECHLVDPWFAQLVAVVRQWWDESGLDAYYPPKDKGSLRTLTVREGISSGDRLVMLTVSGNPEYALNKDQIDAFVAFVRDAVEPVDPNSKLSIFIRIQQTAKGQRTNFYEMHLYGSGPYLRRDEHTDGSC